MTRSPEANAPPTAQKERKKPGRVPTSCAECRRLKLRCDRKVPCENCLKRGCGAICPNGSLTTGKGNRLVLANTEELHNKVEIMSARIHELESALRTAHAEMHNEPHPLLNGTISVVSQNSMEEDSPQSQGSSSSPKPASDPFIDAFGTLTIGTRGETTFMSSTARSEYLLQPSLEEYSRSSLDHNIRSSRLSQRVIDACSIESDSEQGDDELRKLVMSYRPPLSEAVRLCEIYLTWSKTLCSQLSRHELFDEILGSVYGAESYESIPSPHALCLLFSVFALASLFDFNRPAYNTEAYDYHILSRASLEFQSACKFTTLHGVQTLLNIVRYLECSDLRMDPTRAYVFLGPAVKLAYKMGLHLHSARFQLDRNQVKKRSELFWHIFATDTFVSFGAGRPPTVSPDWVDAPYPEDEFAVRNEKGELEMSWRGWLWRWSRLLHEVLVTAFGAKTPTYNTILDLDKKIRDFPIPSHLQLKCPKENHVTELDQVSMDSLIQGLLVLAMKELTLLNIHRRYFSQALQESPNNLLKHKYGPSVMAMYRSAWRLIVSHATAVDRIPNVIARMTIFWSQSFSAAIVMCMIVNKAPNSSLAAPSLHELDVVYDVFKKMAPTAKIASVLLEPITKIWRKGHETVDHPHHDGVLSRAELDRVGGGSTSLIANNSSPSTTSSASSPSSSQTASSASSDASPPGYPSTSGSPFDPSSLHPRIMQDMQTFDTFQQSFPPTASATTATTATTSAATAAVDVLPNYTYTPPAHFSNSLMDTQFNQNACTMTVEACTAHLALNTFHPAQPQPFHSYGSGRVHGYANGHANGNGHGYGGMGAVQPDGLVLDSAWQSFVEQLGF